MKFIHKNYKVKRLKIQSLISSSKPNKNLSVVIFKIPNYKMLLPPEQAKKNK